MNPQLLVGCYRLEFFGEQPVSFPNFPGSAWRGALGHALVGAACIDSGRECPPCRLPCACPYGYLFETARPASAEKMRLYQQVPHPFALRLEHCAARSCVLRLHLFGRANGYVPLVVSALRQAGRTRHGIARNRLMLGSIQQEAVPGEGDWRRIDHFMGTLVPLPPASPTPPPCPASVEIRLLTPLRAKKDGAPAGRARLDFGAFFSTLLRRISMLTYFHGEAALEADFKALTTAARSVRAQGVLQWRDQVRYSARQRTAMKLGGVVGVMRLEGEDLSPFWPFLWLGQWTHAGAAATMGNGAYELASLPSAATDREPGRLAAHDMSTQCEGFDARES